jgi:hypothetical protein
VKKRFGIDYILTQDALKNMNAAPAARTPDFAIQPTIGNNGTAAVVYTSPPLTKHVEHGGFNSSDTHVPLFVSGPGVKQGITENEHVYPVQIAPTVAHNMCLSLKTAVLAPLVDAASSQISCNNAHAQSAIKSSGLPLAVPLFGAIPMTFWLFRRDKNMEVA